MTPKLSKIFPESCLLIVVGVVIGVLLFQASSVHVSPLTPDTFFLYMLPPIILDAGYFMPNRLFFDHLGTILLFAVLGTIFNTLSIGRYNDDAARPRRVAPDELSIRIISFPPHESRSNSSYAPPYTHVHTTYANCARKNVRQLPCL